MRFSLLLEVQIASPTRARERQALLDTVEQGVLAEALGYDGVWAVEHHGLVEYSHSSAPEVFLSFIAARTHDDLPSATPSPSPRGAYNHPIRVAERVATLDVLSGGRVRWGSGKSALGHRAGQLRGRSGRSSTSQWREALEMIPRMWRADVFEWEGRHYYDPADGGRSPSRCRSRTRRSTPPAPVPSRWCWPGRSAWGRSTSPPAPTTSWRRRCAGLPVGGRGGARAPGRQVQRPVLLHADRAWCSTTTGGRARSASAAARFFAESLATYFFSPHRVVGELDVNRAAAVGRPAGRRPWPPAAAGRVS